MKKDNRNLLYPAFALMVGYPLYVAGDVWLNGIQSYCTSKKGRPTGAFCDWGPDLGALLFGETNAHRGFALLMLLVAVVTGSFLYYIAKPAKTDSR